MSKIFKFKDAKKSETPERTVLRFVNEEVGAKKLGAMLVEYAPKVTSPGVHYHEERESAYIVLEGSAVMKLDGVEHHLESGMVAFLAPGDVHGIVAIGEEGFKMLEIWSPLGQDRISVQEQDS